MIIVYKKTLPITIKISFQIKGFLDKYEYLA